MKKGWQGYCLLRSFVGFGFWSVREAGSQGSERGRKGGEWERGRKNEGAEEKINAVKTRRDKTRGRKVKGGVRFWVSVAVQGPGRVWG